MDRRNQGRQPRLDYKNDTILFESEHFISIANPFQKRAHLIIRAKRDADKSFQNNLEDFDDPLKDEFWHIVQQTVAETKKPSMICHHFGGWRSADHFHVHIVLKKRDFADYVSKRTNHPENEQKIIDLISQKSEQLVNRHLNEFKAQEIKDLKSSLEANRNKFTHEKFEDDEFGGFRIELDRDYPWIKFIPVEQPQYSRDPKEVQKQLKEYRQKCFSAMFLFAEQVACLKDVFFLF
ncbi:hypothetical protein TRFO_25332 [Tritrichomonas foetus]|uniref:HIT domain-containing protein n=1 Tax=Tritrichomonas foetus TaxID=1144522 RepID=A0A1J4KAV3_9EUKA|nr:hypothetical protein TRFO_25332 [Tritrichomonas foetus]|eukprot:OHT06589.1 hypothetical protein TRFO_25332 [Tritrichomonas foetus]